MLYEKKLSLAHGAHSILILTITIAEMWTMLSIMFIEFFQASSDVNQIVPQEVHEEEISQEVHEYVQVYSYIFCYLEYKKF